MSGILEQILVSVQTTQAMVQAMQQQVGMQIATVQPVQPVQPVVDPVAAQRAALQAQMDALSGAGTAATSGGLQVVAETPQGITGDMLTALIMPHIDNAAIKDALGVAMRAAGIGALPEAQPHQFGDLYVRFQGVLRNAGLTQNADGTFSAPVAAANTSII